MLYPLVNVPSAASKIAIVGTVEDERIEIWADKEGQRLRIADMYIGSHMLKRPDDLRKMIAREIASVIGTARDVGYAQALDAIRQTLGIK